MFLLKIFLLTSIILVEMFEETNESWLERKKIVTKMKGIADNLSQLWETRESTRDHADQKIMLKKLIQMLMDLKKILANHSKENYWEVMRDG